uniref:Uncharacterized protein n=1 Tax=Alexandrium monilatum TaxID=311494 RepID=A0A7S4PUF8_9DINO|mmetsp:Transcript_68930/g.217938  ORF Transcript_68930/g.217938 Transcript_68930/m.217938 type:complete len:194 (+) Transcript_68930:194-775(+)
MLSVFLSPADHAPQRHELEALPIEELQGILRDRESAIADLEEEIARLKQAPWDFEERLACLEARFGSMAPRDIVKVTPEAYGSVGHRIQEELGERHGQAKRPDEKPGLDLASARQDITNLWPTDLALGQSYVPLDEELLAERARPPPPPDHLEVPEGLRASAHFVGPWGRLDWRPLRQVSPYQPFWLDSPALI